MIKKLIKDPGFYMIALIGRILPDKVKFDELYLKALYKNRMKKTLNIKNPNTYNEKLQWLKLYDRNPIYTTMVDKYEVKNYVREIIGEEYIIPTIGVWDKFEDINFDNLPKQFVLKCTHDSGGLIICKDKSKLDIKEAKKKINHSLRRNYYLNTREWPYKNVKPRIIAEKYMVDESGTELKDYKFFCFDGEPKALFIASDRNNDTKFDFYDMSFKHLDLINGYKNSDKVISCPKGFEKMKELSRKLSKGLPHARIDFYDINGKVYFGEITFFHWSGLVAFEPEEWDYTFGEWIELENIDLE